MSMFLCGVVAGLFTLAAHAAGFYAANRRYAWSPFHDPETWLLAVALAALFATLSGELG